MKLIEKKLVTKRGRLKDEVDKSYISRKKANLMWLDYVQLVIYKFRDHDIINAFPFRCKLCQTYKYKYECSLVINLPTYLKDWREKPKDQWEHLSPVGKWMSLKKFCRYRKTSQPNDESLKRKTVQGSINEKTS